MKTRVVVMIMVASGTVSAVVVMAWTGIYFSTHPSTYSGVNVANVTNTTTDVSIGVGPYDVDLENLDLDVDEVNRERMEKVKEVNKILVNVYLLHHIL